MGAFCFGFLFNQFFLSVYVSDETFEEQSWVSILNSVLFFCGNISNTLLACLILFVTHLFQD